MDSRKLVLRETAVVAIGQVICVAAMIGICALLGLYSRAILLGGIFGGIWQGLQGLHSYVFATPGIFAILMFASPDEPMNLLHVLIAAAIGFAVSLAATLVLYRPAKEN
jgi:PTS system beta-glucosides-specific IIC component